MLLRMAGVIALSCVCGNAFAEYGFDPVSALAPSAVGAYSIAVGDVTGDDRDDVVALGTGSHPYYRGKVLVYAQQATGGFSAPVAHAFSAAPPDYPYQLALADLDADGDLDIVVSYEIGYQNMLALLRNDGGVFAVTTYPQGSPLAGFEFMDVDEDDHLDIVAASAWWTAEVQVLHGDGSGGIRDQASYAIDPFSGTWHLVDMDNDGKRDIVYRTSDGVFMRRHQDGGFSSVPRKVVNAGASWTHMVFGDFNDDGQADIAAVTGFGSDNRITVYPQSSNGTYRRYQSLEAGAGWKLLVHDMDGDGRDDLLMTNYDSTLDVFFSKPGGFHPRASFGADSGSTLAFGDFNDDGLEDVAMAQSSISLLLSRASTIEDDLAVFMGLVPNAAALRVENRGALTSQTYLLDFRIDARVGTVTFGELPADCYDYSWTGHNQVICTNLPPLAPGAHRVFAFPFTLSTGGGSNVLNARGEVLTDYDLHHDNNIATERLLIGTFAPLTTTRQQRR